ncbi:MAG: indolepyruvate oxidoreductase subunit beta family protein [Pseudomonadota bacterium]
MSAPRPISIAITALGGQGGGVLAGWIVAVAEAQGYIAQSTSVPGVAQRTGATVYCVELFSRDLAQERGKPPVLALMPMPGDVDIVIAAEWMEAGRAILRGFVTPARTTLIASTHRDYAIAEKAALGDGIADAQAVAKAAHAHARRLIAFDMNAAASEAGCAISAVLLGALAGAGALPFPRAAFEDVIRASARSVDNNLAGFAMGHDLARSDTPKESPPPARPAAFGAKGAEHLVQRLRRDFPHQVHGVLLDGARRLADYQDRRYVSDYAERLKPVLQADDKALSYRLTRVAARHLALWMSYEDTIRVADLKTRAARFKRVREEVRAGPGHIVITSEFMHPRLEELRDTLPRPLGALIARMGFLRSLFKRGRRITTTALSGFFLLRAIAMLRPLRRATYRHGVEMAAIDRWLDRIIRLAHENYDLAVEVAQCQGLVKGYGKTHERGMRHFNAIMEKLDQWGDGDGIADKVRRLRTAALADEEGAAFAQALREV